MKFNNESTQFAFDGKQSFLKFEKEMQLYNEIQMCAQCLDMKFQLSPVINQRRY